MTKLYHVTQDWTPGQPLISLAKQYVGLRVRHPRR